MSTEDPHPEPKKTPGRGAGVLLAPGIRVRDEAIEITFVRSSGPGGQNVNKRATKAQLRVALDAIPLNERAMKRLRRLAKSAITTKDELLIERDDTRSQARNRRACMDRLKELIARAVIEPKKRRKTKPTKGSIRRRLDAKSRRSEKKRLRKPPKDND